MEEDKNIIYKAKSNDGKYEVICVADDIDACTFIKKSSQQSGATQQMSKKFGSRNAAKHYINNFMHQSYFMGVKYHKEIDRL